MHALMPADLLNFHVFTVRPKKMTVGLVSIL